MADDTITQMVNDPDFGKLSLIEQRKALAAHDPIFAKVGDEDISTFIQAHQTAKQNIPSGTTAENMHLVEEANKSNSPYPLTSPLAMPGMAPSLQPNISGSRPLTPEEQAQENEAFKKGMPSLVANVATEGGASLPLLARMATTGGAAGLTSAGLGGSTGDVAANTALGGGSELLGGAASKIGEKLSPMASQALARILRLSPKAFQFGREPAEEVLRSGIEGGSLKTLVDNIGQASKETTSQLNSMLKSAPGTVNIEDAALNVANTLPGNAGTRFLKVVDDAAAKLGFRSNQMSSLTNAEANALKQEVARQAKFVEGDLRPSIANAGKVFGGKVKDGIVSNVPAAEDLLQSSANLTEASKAGDYAVRAEKAGQGKGALSAVDIKSPSTYPRMLTDTVMGAKTLFRFANALKDSGVPISQVLRTAFQIVYPQSGGQ